MTAFNMSDFKIWKFPNGEWGVQLFNDKKPDDQGVKLNFLFPEPLNPDIYLLLLTIKVLRERYGRLTELHIPYIPYLRQDRSFVHGNPCAAQPLLDILDDITMCRITTLNPHSFADMFIPGKFFDEISRNLNKTYVTVAPDENAVNSTTWVPDIILKKNRTQHSTIVLTETERTCSPVPLSRAMILDDLCDGGATFIACAEKLREMGFTFIGLCIAHGFFSKGVDHLFNNGIDLIVTTNSVCKLTPLEDKIRIFDCFTYEEIINE